VSIFKSLEVAATSLRTQQQAMDVISQNIANVNTPGYSRQTPQLVSAQPDHIYSKGQSVSLGNGVALANVQRSVDSALTAAQFANNSQLSYAQTMQQGLSGVQAAFGSLGSPGIASTLDAFFTAEQQLTNTPQDATLRQRVLSSAQDLATQITSMRKQLTDAQKSADQKIDPLITKTNTLLDKIGSLNQKIAKVEAGNTGSTANDLRDQRDQAVRDLAKLIPVQQVSTNNGGMMLQTPGGGLLVQGGTVRHLQHATANGPSFGSIVFADNGLPASGIDQGGEIGALVALRDTKLGGYIGSLDSLAKNLIFSVNQQHVNGTGTTAASTYTSGQAATAPNGTTTAVNLDNNVPFSGKIQTGSFKVHVLDSTGAPLNPPGPGGTTISVQAGTTTLSGIANQINAINGATASVSNGRLVVNGNGNRVVFGSDNSNFLAAYEVNGFFHGGSAGDISVSSGIQNDPGRIATAAINPTTSQVSTSDNTVAKAILGLRDKSMSVDGSSAASPVQRAGNLAGNFGLDVAAANQQVSYRQAEASSLSSQRQSVSGVNMDQELISMLKFQRAYQGAAKVIQSSNTMLDSLMGLIR